METDIDGLVEQACQGRTEAFAALVRRHQLLVRSFLARFVDAEEVDDVAQEAFLAAYRRLDSYRGEASFSTWLLGIARRQALQHLRSEGRRRRHHQALAQQLDLWRSGKLERADDQLHEDRLEALRSCLDQLPPASRGIIERFYFQNHSSQQLAEQLNKNHGAVRMTLLRVRRALGRCVASKMKHLAEQS